MALCLALELLALDRLEPPATPGHRAYSDPRPNVVVILTDDQRRGTLAMMPEREKDLLVDRGTERYPRAMVPTSLCCPSRATILTGLYAHTRPAVRQR